MTFESNSPFLAESTIVPEQEDLFIPYFNQLYGDIVNAVNTRDTNYYLMQISDVATNIPNLAQFGAFIVTIAGQNSTQPVITYSLCKATSGVAGQATQLGFQAGTGDWNTNVLTITSTATNFQVAHDRAGVTGSFNVRILGTQ